MVNFNSSLGILTVDTSFNYNDPSTFSAGNYEIVIKVEDGYEGVDTANIFIDISINTDQQSSAQSIPSNWYADNVQNSNGSLNKYYDGTVSGHLLRIDRYFSPTDVITINSNAFKSSDGSIVYLYGNIDFPNVNTLSSGVFQNVEVNGNINLPLVPTIFSNTFNNATINGNLNLPGVVRITNCRFQMLQ